jgi:alanine dehydrogenase
MTATAQRRSRVARVIPVFRAADVRAAVFPREAYDAVRDAFIAHARGEWSMPPKVYVTNYPAGDFRAMPALGGGHALLKWVTSFPGNPARGLPTVTGLVLLSDAEDGRLLAVLDAGAVTALRTAAAAVISEDTLARTDASSWSVVGAGVNGAETARMLIAHGRRPLVWDVDESRPRPVAEELGALIAPSAEEALACDVVATVTPGYEVLYREGALRPGQHVSLMGADGPGKAEVAIAEIARARLFCDDWEQASHGGELTGAVAAGVVSRADVTDLGAVLTGSAEGRRNDDDITLFDSTGLAIQDLAVAKAAFEKSTELDLPTIEL